MPTIQLEIDPQTLQRLDIERELLGFEDKETYLHWVVQNRVAIEAGSELGDLLSKYAQRVEELERQLKEAGIAEDADDGDEVAATLTPERVERIADERLNEDANELRGVEAERLDELARRAVAKTREQLGREPGTGLDYRSQTSLADDLPEGADLVDLSAIDVPGHDDDLVERRRRAIGAAVAYLRDEGASTRSEFVDALFEEYPAGYDTEDGWWRCIKRGLNQVPLVDGGEGSRTWEFAPNRPSLGGVTVTRISDEE